MLHCKSSGISEWSIQENILIKGRFIMEAFPLTNLGI